ncbi:MULTISPECIES: SDR family oxidoreductase [Nguyenibacter]|uniref:SDR family NAD(P)-dependent oxidoreductase n=1 Tax=Nguyenibacter vanlangensis TaxID=1216886 RepID=A0A7Y7IVX3_9PROT|nr:MULTISPECIES: SDR family NAD(P)-dependent oxidoreductase [Nguyenibacter]NVN11252.1 SDR family NAD(P)-dependent oxidoreductase [Nguyenibacter vanlangensis]WRH88070.1 SDR family NAD(P)-dependent oxidoreductase [Nguyenibacter sp. L1]
MARRRPGGEIRFDPATILMTGASSGIGAETARFYARAGRTLILWGRDAGRLEQVARDCRAAGATVITRVLDLSDGQGALAAFRQDDSANPVDLLVLAAGLGDMRPSADKTERAETVLELGLVNYATPAALATAAAERMVARRRGHIVLVGSVAAFHALPFAAGYSGSKAGLTRFAEALRNGIGDHGVGVTLISPGFVDTPMSRRVASAKPFLQSAPQAARLIARAVEEDRAHLIFPRLFAGLRLLDQLLPAPVRSAILRRLKADQAPRPAA